jgi:ferric-dicitrate binding protein FerR (iron transport regulator)
MEEESQHIDPVGLLPKVLAGEATSEEMRVVKEWQSASQANRNEYQTFARLWNITGTVSVSDDIDLETEWQKMESAITPTRTRIFGMDAILKIAAAIILVSSLAFIGLKIIGIRSEKAPVAALSAVVLPDGSTVSMNAGSKITYRKGFGTVHRNLRLKGEAYFEVNRNTVPFTITAGEASVRVTGTRFNVSAYSGKPEIKVTVTEGTVNLYESGQPLKRITLRAGETGIYDKSSSVLKKQATVNLNDLAWKTRILDFQNTPMHEVADILMNTYHVPVTLDPSVRNCVLTVHFENQELDSLLIVLQSTLDLTITKKGKHTFIKGKGC